MNLTPTQQLHYDAINKKVHIMRGRDQDDYWIPTSYKQEAAQACAKITEIEKLKFAIEQLKKLKGKAFLFNCEIDAQISELQQQLNELTR